MASCLSWVWQHGFLVCFSYVRKGESNMRKLSFSALMAFMTAWQNENNKYIQTWETTGSMLTIHTNTGEEYTFPTSMINQFYN